MKISKIWKLVLAVTLALWGLWLLDVINWDSVPDLVGIGSIASAVFLLIDK